MKLAYSAEKVALVGSLVDLADIRLVAAGSFAVLADIRQVAADSFALTGCAPHLVCTKFCALCCFAASNIAEPLASAASVGR